MKVALWIQDNQLPVVTNDMIAQELDISVGTIGAAKNVLEREYQAITRKKISEKIGEGDRHGHQPQLPRLSDPAVRLRRRADLPLPAGGLPDH